MKRRGRTSQDGGTGEGKYGRRVKRAEARAGAGRGGLAGGDALAQGRPPGWPCQRCASESFRLLRGVDTPDKLSVEQVVGRVYGLSQWQYLIDHNVLEGLLEQPARRPEEFPHIHAASGWSVSPWIPREFREFPIQVVLIYTTVDVGCDATRLPLPEVVNEALVIARYLHLELPQFNEVAACANLVDATREDMKATIRESVDRFLDDCLGPREPT